MPHSHSQDGAIFSGEVDEIMSRSPNWMLRWGITIIAGSLLMILFMSWQIRYPDMITSQVSVTGTVPAVDVVARKDGHLEELRVTEKQEVKKGEILAIIKAPAESESVFRVKEEVRKLLPFLNDPNAFAAVDLATENQLGRLQSPYSEFQRDYLQYRTLLGDDFSEKSILLLQQQLERKQAQVANMQEQTAAIQREFELAKLKYERMKILHQRDSLSTAELQDHESDMLSTQRQYSGIMKSFNEEEFDVIGVEKQIRDLTHERSRELRQARDRLRESLKKLLSEIEIWESEYVLRAPIDGAVVFYEIWTGQQYVKAGSQVFIVAPDSTALVGRMQVKNRGAGKIEPGHLVRIKFTDFPYKEFGVVTGTVKSVSMVARDGAHLVLVDLPYPLVSNFEKEIPFKQEMTGEASVVTRDMSLIGRIFNEIRKAFVYSMN